MKRQKREQAEMFFNKFSLITSSLLICFFGILMITFSGVFGKYENAAITVAQLFISVSVGSMLLEWFGFVNYTRKRMSEILISDEVLKVLNMKRKRELKSLLLKNIYMYNAPKLQNEDNNILMIIDRELDNILKDYYFDEYIIYTDVSILEQNSKKYIKKNFRHTFKAKSINRKKCTLGTPINTYLKPPQEDLKAFELKSFKINGNQLDIKGWNVCEKNNDCEMKNIYPKHYTFEEIIDKNSSLFSFKNEIDVDFEYITIVDIDDLVYTYQVNRPCKHFCIHFNAPKEYKILMEGFGFMSTGNSQRQRCVETENGCMIRFLDWILPGNGIMAVLQKI